MTILGRERVIRIEAGYGGRPRVLMLRCISSVECLSYDTSFIAGKHDDQATPPLEGEGFLHGASSSDIKASEQRTDSSTELSAGGPNHAQSSPTEPAIRLGANVMQ